MSGVRVTRAIKTSTKQIDKVDVLDGANSLKKLLEVVMIYRFSHRKFCFRTDNNV